MAYRNTLQADALKLVAVEDNDLVALVLAICDDS